MKKTKKNKQLKFIEVNEVATEIGCFLKLSVLLLSVVEQMHISLRIYTVEST